MESDALCSSGRVVLPIYLGIVLSIQLILSTPLMAGSCFYQELPMELIQFEELKKESTTQAILSAKSPTPEVLQKIIAESEEIEISLSRELVLISTEEFAALKRRLNAYRLKKKRPKITKTQDFIASWYARVAVDHINVPQWIEEVAVQVASDMDKRADRNSAQSQRDSFWNSVQNLWMNNGRTHHFRLATEASIRNDFYQQKVNLLKSSSQAAYPNWSIVAWQKLQSSAIDSVSDPIWIAAGNRVYHRVRAWAQMLDSLPPSEMGPILYKLSKISYRAWMNLHGKSLRETVYLKTIKKIPIQYYSDYLDFHSIRKKVALATWANNGFPALTRDPFISSLGLQFGDKFQLATTLSTVHDSEKGAKSPLKTLPREILQELVNQLPNY